VATAGILMLVNLVVRIRVATDVEEAGLDLAQHGEVAYQA
jgi:ammonia channel protein AmtB